MFMCMEVFCILLESKNEVIVYLELEWCLFDVDCIILYCMFKIFEEKGLVYQVVDLGNVVKYVLCKDDCMVYEYYDEYVYFYCQDCGKIVCLDIIFISIFQVFSGFKVV